MNSNEREMVVKFVVASDLIDADDFQVPWGTIRSNAKMAAIPFTVTKNDYNAMTSKDRKKMFLAMTWPRDVPTSAPNPKGLPRDKILRTAVDTTKIGAASVIRHRVGALSDDTDMGKVIAALCEMFPKHTLESVIGLLSKVVAVVPGMDQSMSWGNGEIITSAELQQWSLENKGAQEIVGPYKFWKLVAKMGYSWARKTTTVKHRDVVTYTKNGIDLHCVDKFQIHSVAMGDKYLEATQGTIDKFLTGVYYKGRQVVYRHISVYEYKVANAFLTKYKVEPNDEGVAHTSLIKALVNKQTPYTLPMFDDEVLEVFDALNVRIAQGAIKSKTAEDIYEALARLVTFCVDKQGKPFDMEIVATCLDDAADIAATKTNYAVDKLVSIRSMTVENRLNELLTSFNATGDANKACDLLKDARQLRNASQAGAIVNHNVCSTRGAYFTEWVDTYEKGYNIMHYISENVTLKIDDTTKCDIYGVAYGHMTSSYDELPIINKAKNLRFYDIAKPPGSSEQFEKGDVFKHDRRGAWVIDDTDSHKLPKEYATIKKGYTGDHLKIENFIKSDAQVIISKVSFKHFRHADQQLLWKRILFRDTAKYSVELVKFGKLHNAECYLCLIRDENDSGSSEGTLLANVATIAMALQVSNRIIMYWQELGLRMDLHVWDSVHKCYPLIDVWMMLVGALPTVWSWYFKQAFKERSASMLAAIEEAEAHVDNHMYNQDKQNALVELFDAECLKKK